MSTTHGDAREQAVGRAMVREGHREGITRESEDGYQCVCECGWESEAAENNLRPRSEWADHALRAAILAELRAERRRALEEAVGTALRPGGEQPWAVLNRIALMLDELPAAPHGHTEQAEAVL